MSSDAVPSPVPPLDAKEITSDGGLRKVVVRQGTGDLPPLHSRCLVHFIGRIAGTGETFMNSRQESALNEPFKLVAGRDSITREKGLNVAVATMQRGERCHLWVSPEYGYGETGSFSFPTVPPNASLTYDIELLDFEPPTEGKEQRDMTYEERLEAAERRRSDGNAAYMGGQYEEAIRKYNAALAFVDEDLLIQLQGFHYDRAMEARLPGLLNASACHLKLGEYHAVVSAASQVLSHDARNAKGLFRRGAARHALGQTEQALVDLKAAREAAPGDAGIARELAALKETILKERQAQGKVFKGLVDKFGATGGLYEEEDKEPPIGGVGVPFEATNLLDGGEFGRINEDQSWFMWLMESLCPFVFDRRKKEA